MVGGLKQVANLFVDRSFLRGTVLMGDGKVGREAVERLRSQFEEVHRGSRNGGDVRVLEVGLNMKPSSNSFLSPAIAILLGSLRIAGVKTIAFQAVAHVFMGWLLRGAVGKKPLDVTLLLGLSALECFCFAASRPFGNAAAVAVVAGVGLVLALAEYWVRRTD